MLVSFRALGCFLRRFGLAEIPDVPPSGSRTTVLGSPGSCRVRGFFFFPIRGRLGRVVDGMKFVKPPLANS